MLMLEQSLQVQKEREVVGFVLKVLYAFFFFFDCTKKKYIYIYSGYGKYSDPLKFFTLCYIAAIC